MLIVCPQQGSAQSFLQRIEGIKSLDDREAMAQCRTLIQELTEKGFFDTLALVNHEFGVLHYYSGELDSAIVFTERADSLKSTSLPEDYPERVRSLNNLGAFYRQKAEKSKSGQSQIWLQRSYTCFEKILSFPYTDHKTIAAYWSLGSHYNQIGEVQLALEYYANGEQKGRELLLSDNDEKGRIRRSLATCLYLAASTLNTMSDPNAAIRKNQAAVEILAGLRDTTRLVECYLELARSYDLLNDFQRRRRYNRLGLIMANARDQKRQAFNFLNNLGLTYKDAHVPDSAFFYLGQALANARARNHVSDLALAYDNLGVCYEAKGHYQKALEHFQHAVWLTLDADRPEDPYTNPVAGHFYNCRDLRGLLVYLRDKAHCLKSWYASQPDREDLGEAALQAYLLADRLVDVIRSAHSEESSKLVWREDAKPMYDDAIMLSLMLQDEEQAFQLSERSKAILVLDAIREMEKQQWIPDSLIRAESALLREIALAESQAPGTAESGQPLAFRIQNLKQQLEKHRDRIKEQFPRYAAFKYQADTVPLEVLFDKLNTDQTLIAYHVSKDSVLAFVARSSGDIICRTLGHRDTLADILAPWTNPDLSLMSLTPLEYEHLAYRAYGFLLDPLPLNPGIVIIPDGIIGYLPFDMLVRAVRHTDDFRGLDYCLFNHTFQYQFSVTSWLKLQGEGKRHGRILTVAPAVQDEGRLPIQDEEIKKISQVISADLLQGGDATISNFLAKAPGYAVLHLSTHGQSDRENYQFSFLEFSDPEDQESDKLYVRRLSVSDLPVDLVCLSACRTSAGRVAEGEGVMSITRACAQAGARSIVSSYWLLNQKLSGDILPGFYKQLVAGRPKDEALKQAKLAYLNKPALKSAEAHPYFWAALNVMGDMSPLQLQRNRKMRKYLAYGGVLLAITGLLYLIVKYRSKREFTPEAA